MTLASKLNTRVVILQRTTTQDALGQPTESWTELMTVWGNVRYQTGLASLSRLSADEIHPAGRCSIRIRQTACSLGVMSGMRARVGLRQYDILSTQPQGRDAIDLVCKVI